MANNQPKKLLRLDSMTLRGIGSYYHGAELKFRPLTILCGANGSGKSTWFNSLALLQRSLMKGKLPFDFDKSEHNCHDMQWTNAKVNLGSSTDFAVDTKQDDRYGPLGTIGLASTAMEDGSFFEREVGQNDPASSHSAFRLLWLGQCRKGTKFRVRLAHSSEGMSEYHQDLVEMVVDGVYVIRMTRPLGQSRDADPRWPPYLLECSRAFFCADGEGDDEVIRAAQFHLGDGQTLHGVEAHTTLTAIPEELARKCVQLICAVVEHAICGFFPLTAIRDKQEFDSLEPDWLRKVAEALEELEQPIADRTDKRTTDELLAFVRTHFHLIATEERVALRYVGPHGESSHAVLNEFAGYHMHDRGSLRTCSVEEFVSFWMKKFVQTEDHSYAQKETGQRGYVPQGWVDFEAPHPRTPGPDDFRDQRRDAFDIVRWMHPCFQMQSQGPARLSSGFHQLLPIVAQCAVMSRGEILAIENPEVHLHPSLQLAIAEFLMRQALAGRTILVETHSDLIIRRLIRAVLEEEIKQEALSIQFVSLKSVGTNEAHSSMEPLRIGDDGRIENWPDGFLTDDVRESRRLFEILYGAIPEADQEGVG